ncbi:hypothetical protein MKX03_010358 [Papaver bracteatum]|nr:hypothetical protein MKX03_010358 [Papaver bracteatum]
MSPSQFRHHHHHDDNDLHRQQQQQQQRLIINDVNCLRKSGTPLPLKINKESHQIHKSSSSSLTSSATSSINGVINMSSTKNQQQQQRHPVIIYTHSPKVIHTQACDFMALVQKLTGLSHADQQQNQSGGSPVDTKQSVSSNGINKFNNNGSSNNLRGGDDTGSSSVVTTDENCGGGGGGFGLNIHQVSSSGSMDPMNNSNNNPYITDIPIFTPNSLEFPYITRSLYSRYPSPMIFPSTGNSAEITKPEY